MRDDEFIPSFRAPSVWTHHALFVDAPMITGRRTEIDALLGSGLRLLDRTLSAMFVLERPQWPAYDRWVHDRLAAGEKLTIFGPIEKPCEPDDMLPFTSLAGLRRKAVEHGLKPGRSKIEIGTQLRQSVKASDLESLEADGRRRWHRYETVPFELTLFGVLGHTIERIQSSARDAMMYEAARIQTAAWITRGGSDTCARCRAAEGTIVRVGATIPGVNVAWPPAHPGCACSFIVADGDMRPPDLEQLTMMRRNVDARHSQKSQ